MRQVAQTQDDAKDDKQNRADDGGRFEIALEEDEVICRQNETGKGQVGSQPQSDEWPGPPTG